MTHPWPAGSAAGGNALRVRASSDAEFYLIARVTLADGSAYEAEANLPAGDEQAFLLEPFLPAFDTPTSPAGLDWERVINLTLFAYPAPTQSAARLEVLGVDVVDVAPSRAWIEARSDHFLVWHHAGDESAAQVALRALEERYTTLAAVTGMSPGGRVPILLAADHAELERLQGERLSAWMIGGSLHSSVMLLTPRRYSLIYNGKQAERFPEVASHEVTHLLVARAASYRGMWAMPVWLHEGLAVYVAGQDAAEVDSLRRAASRGQLPALAELAGEAGFRQQARWAYPMAGEVVRYLAETYGPESLGTLQQAFREGQAADAALQALYGLSTDALDAEWRAALAGTP